MDRQHKSEMVRVLGARLKDQSFDGKSVLLFGHCNATEEMADHLLTNGVAPAAILDNNIAKQGLAYRGIRVASPGSLSDYDAQNSIILIANRFFSEMVAQCRRLGYNGEVVQVVGYNSFAEYSLADETITLKIERMKRGAHTLKRIHEQYPTQHLIICPNNALGDVYWAMSFLPAYLEKNHIGNVAIVVVGDACRQVAEMFGIGHIATLESKEMDEFVQAVVFTREDASTIAQHDRPYTNNTIKWVDKHFLSFVDCYRYAVYGLAKDTQPTLPHRFTEFVPCVDMPKGKTIILSPYAKSVVELPTEFWETLVMEYSAKGYSLYTNIVADEQPISGTVPLRLPICQMVPAVEYAGTFIGIRSGLCDVLNTANCRKTVVFPDCYYSTTPHKVADFFALPGWEII